MAELPLNIGQLADDVIQTASHFESLIALAAALKGVASIDSEIANRNALLARAVANHESAEKDLENVRVDLTAARNSRLAEADAHARAMTELRRKTLADAASEADKILSEARSKAESQSASAIAASAARQEEADKALADVQERTRTAQADLDAIVSQLDAARKTHSDLSRRLAAVRAEAKQLAS